MIAGMTMEKIAITVPRDLLRKARGASRRARTSLSAYIARSLELRVEDEDLQSMLDGLLAATGGPLTTKERREADAILGLKPRRRK